MIILSSLYLNNFWKPLPKKTIVKNILSSSAVYVLNSLLLKTHFKPKCLEHFSIVPAKSLLSIPGFNSRGVSFTTSPLLVHLSIISCYEIFYKNSCCQSIPSMSLLTKDFIQPDQDCFPLCTSHGPFWLPMVVFPLGKFSMLM